MASTFLKYILIHVIIFPISGKTFKQIENFPQGIKRPNFLKVNKKLNFWTI